MPLSKAACLFKLCLTLTVISLTHLSLAANQEPEPAKLPDLTDLSVEALLELDVTSVTKTPTGLKDVPAAIYVLTSDDIHRSGATTIPEALRVVPGMHVARIDGNKWAVSTRGFNSQYANKLLVLMDGRILYTPMFSGVWWDQEDVMMEDIERIEVIRGPGASLWGANAVNGVINIITKKVKNTQGALISGAGGSMRKSGGLRYGVGLGNQAYLKVYGRHSEYDQTHLPGTDTQAGDDSRLSKIGFRVDKDFSGTDKLTLQGDAFSGSSGGAGQQFPTVSAKLAPVLSPPYSRWLPTDSEPSGHYLMGRWEHGYSNDSSTVLRMYWNRNERKFTAIDSSYQIDTLDFDFQHNVHLDEEHNLVWGAGARLNYNDTQNSLDLSWLPNQRQDQIYSLFAQDEITLVPARWKLTLGSKFEHNPVTQFEWQPTARLSWTPVKQHAFWASVSRSVRTPNWAEQDLNYNKQVIPPAGGGVAGPANPVTLISFVGNKAMQSEKMLAYDWGWRAQLGPRLSADVALYYYDYHNILSGTPSALDASRIVSGYLLQTYAFTNYGSADVYGGEASVDWRVTDTWKLRATYSQTEQRFRLSKLAPAGTGKLFDGGFPAHQAMLWSMHQLTPQINVDLWWRYVDGFKENPPVQAFHELDARLARRFRHGLELALVGRNLLETQHVEFGSYLFSIPTAAQREVYATLSWNF
ncbi:MAG: TonB-dependent receptor [Methylovulum sp.]|uniref:TonB-dependent receptor plug domain-containing protein n=1 Tax=Methylovulum sp. TaxID=1916980 RepID=UPI00261FEFC2|nr:TonB-dependent receptor [Methylovulum sp.]MDD2724269.1 TonB-dependent receptor [Methylovulum sp.]MDD5122998.1 TonB-dependent receptor [Methylovulum sp.]